MESHGESVAWAHGYRWGLSLVAGALSIVFSVFVQPFDPSAMITLPFVVALSGAGIFLGGMSFVARERKRYWAIAGVALALAAVFLLEIDANVWVENR